MARTLLHAALRFILHIFIYCSVLHSPLLLANSAEQKMIYKYYDEKGVLHLTNVPPAADEDVLYSRSYLVHFYQPPPTPALPSLPLPALARHNSVYAEQIASAARLTQVPMALLAAVIQVESAYNPKALSPKGAQGLMQLMPATAKRYGVKDSYDPADNIHGGARYLRDLLDMFKGDMSLALAAYNAGEGAVLKYGKKIPPYRETQAYVKKVLHAYRNY